MPRNTAPAMDQIPYRLPLVIGATGHRDLRDEDIPALEGAVAKVIERLKRDYLKDTRWSCRVPGLRVLCRWLGLCVDRETPLIVLSSLAEGADRLIARVAMKLGAKLIAPLPLEPDEYRRDFEPEGRIKPNAAEDFDSLLAQAVEARVMPFAKANSDEPDPLAAIRTDPNKRALQYREVGLFIVRHCHVLIALWNGDESNTAVGGTTEVVRFKRDGIPLEVTESAQASLDAPEIGPVIHILTPRAKDGDHAIDIATQPWGADIDRRQAEAWENFQVQTDLTRRFNDEAAELERDPKRARNFKQSLTYLFDDPEEDRQKKIPGGPASERAMKLVPHWCTLYGFADTLAQECGARFRRDWKMLFGLAFATLVSFEVLTHLAFDQHWLYWLLGAYVVVSLAVFGWFFNARRRKHQERFLDYRALAEALRVAVFWKLVGIGWPPKPGSPPVQATVDLSSGDSVAKAYPIRQPRELDWVKTCLRTLELLDSEKLPATLGHNFETDGHAWARAFWVHGQLAFFRRRGPTHDDEATKLLRGSFILVILSVVLAGFLFLADHHFLGRTFSWDHVQWPHRIFIFLIGLLPGFAAVLAGYSERLALEAQARLYDRMRILFARAHEILQSHPPVEFRHIQALYGELGAEAMKESAEWVSIYRQRPIRPP
jgi:hypothetical protein